MAACGAAAISITGVWAQSVVPGQHAGKLKVENRIAGKAQSFDLRGHTTGHLMSAYGRSNIEWGRTRNIDGIPGLIVMGEYEWWDARLRPALAFRPRQSVIQLSVWTGSIPHGEIRAAAPR